MATVGEKLNEVLLMAAQEAESALDQEMERLDNLKEDDLEDIRRKRLEQMKHTHVRNKELKMLGHGEYQEICGEKEFFSTAKKSTKVICHFYRPATWRCQVIDKHLSLLASRHMGTRMVKLNIEKSPYLAEKLRIIMLPTVSFIKDGKIVGSMIGFDEIGGEDDFETDVLEDYLKQWDIINDE
jgi:hypothetical protein